MKETLIQHKSYEFPCASTSSKQSKISPLKTTTKATGKAKPVEAGMKESKIGFSLYHSRTTLEALVAQC